MSSSSTERHFFLFRHCFRSTGAKVDFYNTNSTNERYSTNDFLNASSALHWTVPNYQCTAQGLQYIQQTGEYLAQEFLQQKTSHQNTTIDFFVRIISDTSQRDLDTAVALKQGMQDFLKRHDSSSFNQKNKQNFQSAIDSLEIETNTAWFNPIKFGDCTQEYTNEQVLQDVQHNLQTVPMPSVLSLPQAVQLVRQHGGGSGLRPIPATAITPPQFLTPLQRTKNNHTKTHLQGAAINLIKSWSIMAYYSRAAAPTEMTFLTTLSWSQVYALLAWQQWSRRVVEINTVQATVGGSQMARVLLEALDGSSTMTTAREQQTDTVTKEDASNQPHTTVQVTLVVGHDGDIDSLSSVLGAYWNGQPPFVAPLGQFWNPTPPGSALHLVQTTANDKELAVEYLYPVLLEPTANNHDPSSMLQLQTVPVYFVQEENGQQQQHVNTLTKLRQRIHSRLQTAPGALDCFDQTDWNTTIMTPKTKTSTRLGLTDTMDNYGRTLLVLVSILSSGWLLYYGLRKRRRRCCSPAGCQGKHQTRQGDSLYEPVAGSETELC